MKRPTPLSTRTSTLFPYTTLVRSDLRTLDARPVFARKGRLNGIIDCPSPNFDERARPVTMLVLHYTGMVDAASAIERLRDPEAGVSSHYLVAEDGQVLRLVDEDKRAWHAGRSHWRGVTDVNSASIGIEIVNPGHEFGDRKSTRLNSSH